MQATWSSHPTAAAVHSNSPQNENENEKNSAVGNEFENALTKYEDEQRERDDILPVVVIVKSEKENNNNNEILDENNEIVNNNNNGLIFEENTELVEPTEQLNYEEIGSPGRIIGSETDNRKDELILENFQEIIMPAIGPITTTTTVDSFEKDFGHLMARIGFELPDGDGRIVEFSNNYRGKSDAEFRVRQTAVPF